LRLSELFYFNNFWRERIKLYGGLMAMLRMNKKGLLSGWLIWAVVFLVIAIVAAIFGFGLISGVSFWLAKWLAIIFVVLFIISVIAHTIKAA